MFSLKMVVQSVRTVVNLSWPGANPRFDLSMRLLLFYNYILYISNNIDNPNTICNNTQERHFFITCLPLNAPKMNFRRKYFEKSNRSCVRGNLKKIERNCWYPFFFGDNSKN